MYCARISLCIYAFLLFSLESSKIKILKYLLFIYLILNDVCIPICKVKAVEDDSLKNCSDLIASHIRQVLALPDLTVVFGSIIACACNLTGGRIFSQGTFVQEKHFSSQYNFPRFYFMCPVSGSFWSFFSNVQHQYTQKLYVTFVILTLLLNKCPTTNYKEMWLFLLIIF